MELEETKLGVSWLPVDACFICIRKGCLCWWYTGGNAGCIQPAFQSYAACTKAASPSSVLQGSKGLHGLILGIAPPGIRTYASCMQPTYDGRASLAITKLLQQPMITITLASRNVQQWNISLHQCIVTVVLASGWLTTGCASAYSVPESQPSPWGLWNREQ